MNRLAPAAIYLAALLTSCAPVPEPAKTPAKPNEQRAASDPAALKKRLVDAMVQPRTCFRGSLDYAIRDPEFLDAALSRLLGRATLEELADNEKEAAQLEREAPFAYTALQSTPDGLARLEKVVSRRFQNPIITAAGDRVTADYGHIAAKLSIAGRGKIGIVFAESPHLDHREWRSTEVAAALEQLRKQDPDARYYSVRVVIPDALLADDWLYTYDVNHDRVLLTFPGAGRRPFLSSKLGRTFAAYIDGSKSFATSALREVNPSIMQPLGGTEPPIRR